MPDDTDEGDGPHGPGRSNDGGERNDGDDPRERNDGDERDDRHGSDGRDGPRLADLVDSPGDIRNLRERFKAMAEAKRDAGADVSVADFLAQTPKNDAAYIRPSEIEKAEWVADIYDREGRPEIHPRGLHYQIIDKGYEMRDGSPYENARSECWSELKEAVKWAQILGLIDPARIEDRKNNDPTPTAFTDLSNPRGRAGRLDEAGAVGDPYGGAFTRRLEEAGVRVDDGYQHADIPSDVKPARLREHARDAGRDGDLEAFIEDAVDVVVAHAFADLAYDHHCQQRYYIEVWSEKAGVIPEDLAAEYGATIRPAGGGEFSLAMCRDAIRIADARDQDLAVVIVSDFDPKGADMPKSAARKLEVLAALDGVEAEVVQAAVTREQVERYGIPGMPGKTPSGLEHGNVGAKGYQTHKEMFRDHAGQYPVEIRAFKSRYEDAFRDELRAILSQYYDHGLDDRLRDAVDAARDDARDALRRAFLAESDTLRDRLDALATAVERYQDRLEPHLEGARTGLEALGAKEDAVRAEVGVEDRRDDLQAALDDIDHAAVLADVSVDVPDPVAAGIEDALLDTRRSLLEQLSFYKDADIRY